MSNVLQNMDNTDIYFNSLKRADWLKQIATIKNEYKKENYQKQVTFVFKDTLSPELFQPIHVVTIACLIEFLVNVEKHTIRISYDTMCTIKLYDVMEGKDFLTAGSSLYDIIRENMNSSDKITINMEGVSSLPSIFLNVSIGKFIDEFGFETLKKKISFAKITKLQAERLTDYISRYKR